MPEKFEPSIPTRNWIVLLDMQGLPLVHYISAIVPGMILTMLFFFDHNVSSALTQDKSFNLQKGTSYHWDFVVVGIIVGILSVLGLPLTNCVLPQSPLHVKSLTYKTVTTITPSATTNNNNNNNNSNSSNEQQQQQSAAASNVDEEQATTSKGEETNNNNSSHCGGEIATSQDDDKQQQHHQLYSSIKSTTIIVDDNNSNNDKVNEQPSQVSTTSPVIVRKSLDMKRSILKNSNNNTSNENNNSGRHSTETPPSAVVANEQQEQPIVTTTSVSRPRVSFDRQSLDGARPSLDNARRSIDNFSTASSSNNDNRTVIMKVERRVYETRLTVLAFSLLVLGMTIMCLKVINVMSLIPEGVANGLFLFMGITSFYDLQFVMRLKLLVTWDWTPYMNTYEQQQNLDFAGQVQAEDGGLMLQQALLVGASAEDEAEQQELVDEARMRRITSRIQHDMASEQLVLAEADAAAATTVIETGTNNSNTNTQNFHATTSNSSSTSHNRTYRINNNNTSTPSTPRSLTGPTAAAAVAMATTGASFNVPSVVAPSMMMNRNATGAGAMMNMNTVAGGNGGNGGGEAPPYVRSDVSRLSTNLFTLLQLVCLLITSAITLIPQTALFFPVCIIAMIFLCKILLPRLFSKKSLYYLDNDETTPSEYVEPPHHHHLQHVFS